MIIAAPSSSFVASMIQMASSGFPLIFGQAVNLKEYNLNCLDGYIDVNGNLERLRIEIDQRLNSPSVFVCGSWQTKQILKNNEDVILQTLQSDCSSEVVLKKIQGLLSEGFRSIKSESNHINTVQLVETFSDIEEIGWDKLVSINSELSIIELKTVDGCGRSHILVLKLEHNEVSPLQDIPTSTVQPVGRIKNVGIKDLFAAFEKEVEKYQPFWDEMDYLDEHSWIIEPEQPKRMHNYRRILLGKNISIHIVVDPENPCEIPKFQFLGPEQSVFKLRNNFSSNIQSWDADDRLLHNFENLLDIKFPLKSQMNTDEFSIECAICYSYDLSGHYPEVVCNYDKCSKIYHPSCLFEWLRSLPDSRQSMNMIFGSCPNCEKVISCKMPISSPIIEPH